MKRKAPTQSSSSSTQAYVVISDSDTDGEDGGRESKSKSKSKSRTPLNGRNHVEVISISSDESDSEPQPPTERKDSSPPIKTSPGSPATTKTEAPDSLWFLPPSSRRGSGRSISTPEPVRFNAEMGIEMLFACANRVAQRQRQWLFGFSTKHSAAATTAAEKSLGADPQEDPQEDPAPVASLSDHGRDESDSEGDYVYNADPLYWGELEVLSYSLCSIACLVLKSLYVNSVRVEPFPPLDRISSKEEATSRCRLC